MEPVAKPEEKTEDKVDEKLPFEMVEVPPTAQAPADAPKPAPVMDVVPPQPNAVKPESQSQENVHPAPPEAAADAGPIPEASPSNDIKKPEASKDPTNLDVDPAKADDMKPAEKKPEEKPVDAKPITKAAPVKMPKPPKPPRQPHEPGVGVAIFMAAVVVVALAAMATYAYLKTNGS